MIREQRNFNNTDSVPEVPPVTPPDDDDKINPGHGPI